MNTRTLDDVIADWKNPSRMLAYYRGPTAVQLIREAAVMLGVVERAEDLRIAQPEFQEVRHLIEEQTGIKA